MANEDGIQDPAGDSSLEETRKLTPAAMEGLLRAGAPDTTRALRRWVPPTKEEVQRALPQYEVTGFIARGGMGAVYKGVQKALKRTVAIKILPSEIVEDDLDFVGRFEREAQSMAALSHSNIVTVYEAGETPEGLLYFTMEYVDGTDVGELLAEKGRLPHDEAVRITVAVLAALECAHGHGIVHRDFKPSNVLINKQGQVKVADFGLAKIATTDGGLTQSLVTVGTPDFLAPETYIAGFVLDHRADIYSVGVMLYKMLTGRVPRGRFDAPSGEVRGMDPRLDRIIDKAMQEDREKRYATATEMRLEVEQALASPVAKTEAAALSDGKEAVTPSPMKRRGAPAWILVAAVIALAAGFFVWWNQNAGTSAYSESTKKAEVTRREWRPAPAKFNATMDRDAVHLQRLDTWGSPDVQKANVAVRSIIAWQPGPPGRNDLIKVTARWTETEHYYACLYGPVVEVGYYRAPKIIALQRWPLEPPPGPDEAISLQLACVGHHLAVWVRDRLVGVMDDDAVTAPGKVGAQAIDGHFRSLDYLDLDGLSAAEAYQRLGLDASGTSQIEGAGATAVVAQANTSKSEHWVNLLEPEASAKLQLKGIAKPGPEGLVVPAKGRATVAGTVKPGCADGALRIRTRLESAARSRLSVRARCNNQGMMYALEVLNPWKLSLQHWGKDGTTTVLKDFVLSKPLQIGEDYEMELRAVGPALIVSLNGKVLGEIADSTITQGEFAVGVGDGQPVTIRALEYLDLSAAGSTGASVVTGNPTADASALHWTKVFPDLQKLPGVVEFTDGWARLSEGIKHIDEGTGKALTMHNGGLSAKRRVPEDWHGGVLLHVRSLDGGHRLNLCYYEPKAPSELAYLQLREYRPETLPPNATAAQAWDAQKLLAEQRIPRIGTEFMTELVVVGNILLGRAGGHTISCTVEDHGTAGRVAIDEASTQFFRDVEVINLDGVPEAEALKFARIEDEPGNGVVAPASSVAAGTPRWRDAFAESPLKDVIVKYGRTSQGWRLPENHHWMISPQSHGAGALRVRATGLGEKFVSIYVDLGNRMVERVRFRSRDGQWLLSRGTVGPDEVDFAVSSGSSPFDGQPHELLFARVGGRLRAMLDGQLLHDEADPSAEEGRFVLDIYPGAEIAADKVEYLNLDGVPEDEARRLLGIEAK